MGEGLGFFFHFYKPGKPRRGKRPHAHYLAALTIAHQVIYQNQAAIIAHMAIPLISQARYLLYKPDNAVQHHAAMRAMLGNPPCLFFHAAIFLRVSSQVIISSTCWPS